MDAEREARSLLADAERRWGPESMEVAEILDELAVSLRRGGKAAADESRQICERAVDIKKRQVGEQDPRYAASLHNLGMLFYARGDAEESRTFLEDALAIRERARDTPPADLAMSRLALGAVYSALGRLSVAEKRYEGAIALQDSTLPADDPDRAYGRIALGALRYRVGAYSNAIPVLEEAIGILRRSPKPNLPLLGDSYHQLGVVLAEMRDSTAEMVLREALWLREKGLGPDHPNVASTMVILGEELQEAGEVQAALRLYLDALRIQTNRYGPDHVSVGLTYLKIGHLHLLTGEVKKASSDLHRSLRILEASLGPNHPNLWLAHVGIAEASHHEGADSEARASFERALRILESAFGAGYIDVSTTRTRFARFLLDIGDSSAALESSLLAAQSTNDHVRLVARGLSERQALAYAAAQIGSLDPALAVVAGARFQADPVAVGRVWDSVLRWRALVLDELATRHRLATGAPDSATALALGGLEGRRQRLANLLVRGTAGESEAEYRSLVEYARSEMERSERDLGRFLQDSDLPVVDLDEVAASIPPSSALVSYVRYGPGISGSLLVLLRQPGGELRAIPLGSWNAIEDPITRWIARTAKLGSERESVAERSSREAGFKVRRLVWDPLAPHLEGVRRLFLVPEGPLHLMNFAALPTDGGAYLVESGPELHYLSAERDLVDRRRRGNGTGLLAMGGISFNRQASSSGSSSEATRKSPSRGGSSDCADFRTADFEALPETRREVQEIAAAWTGTGDALVLTGNRADEAALKALGPGKRAIHLATHAFFLDGRCRDKTTARAGGRGIGGTTQERRKPPPPAAPRNPLRLSGIALAGANQRGSASSGEDGILTAEEVASMDLSRTDWVVLSACETGAGEVQSGEGVLGLRRAFQVAGAGTLITSLWEVEDRSTREWMRALYRERFERHQETAEAVRNASLSVLRERRAQGRATHPFYWASFVAAGDWR